MKRRRRRILILTSHGIRTNAPWQNRLENLVQNEAVKQAQLSGGDPIDVTVLHNNYQYFSLLAFMNPFRRRRETLAFENKLRSILKENKYDEIHLVGHSFGTHIIAHSLRRIGRELKKRIGTVILAGSVLHRSYSWDGLVGIQLKRLVNDCGDRDAILVLNALLPLGSGLAGRRGFAGIMGAHFRNRYFAFGHSGYFESLNGADQDAFMRERWIPLLFGASAIDGVDERSTTFFAGPKGWAVDQCENMKWLIPVALAASFCFLLLYWALVVRTSFNLETTRDAVAIVDAVKRQNLDEAKRIAGERERAIAARFESWPIAFEALFRADVRESLYPPQLESARLATEFASRPIRVLEGQRPFDIRFRGNNTIELLSYVDEEFLGEPGNIRTDRFRLDTLELDDRSMWAWKGELASRPASPKPGVTSFEGDAEGNTIIPPDYLATLDRFAQVTGVGLQDSIERRVTVALADDELSIWNIAEERKIGEWKADRWGEQPITDAHPCGGEGGVTAVDSRGGGHVFAGPSNVISLQLPEGIALAYLLGNSSCRIFAGVSGDGRLLIWRSLGDAPIMPSAEGRVVRSFEFSPHEPGLLLVNTALIGVDDSDNRVVAYSITNEDVSSTGAESLKDAISGVFSPSGKLVVLAQTGVDDERLCRVIGAPGSKDSLQPSSMPFPCPYVSQQSSAQSLSQELVFVDDEREYVTTEARPGDFGHSHLVVRQTQSNATDWLVRASRSDIVSLDAVSDGSLMATVAGDAAGEYFGGDWSFRLWSRFSGQPLYERKLSKRYPHRSWLTPDGSQAIILWEREDSANNVLFNLEFVPTSAGAGGNVNVPPEKSMDWGLTSRDVGAERLPLCEASSTGEGLSQDVPEDRSDIDVGCWTEGVGFLKATQGGQDTQVRFRYDEGNSSWEIRSLAGSGAQPIRFSDGKPLPDDIVAFTSNPAARQMFVAHKNGSVSRLDFEGDLSARTIFGSAIKSNSPIRSIQWIPQVERLGVEYATSAEGPAVNGLARSVERTIIALTANGDLMSTTQAPPELLFGNGVDGTFAANDEYWSVSRVEVASRPSNAPEDEGPEIIYHWFLQNWATGQRISLNCEGGDYEVSSNVGAYEPNLLISRSRRYLASARLGPSQGAYAADVGADVFDLVEGKCIGYFEHGDDILELGLSDDGRLLTTAAKGETYVWHVPTRTSVETVFGPNRIYSDRSGVRIISSSMSDNLVQIPLPDDVRSFLGISAMTVP